MKSLTNSTKELNAKVGRVFSKTDVDKLNELYESLVPKQSKTKTDQ
ncbi:MAG: hypothetical protein HKN90_08725 [Flavobacteriaceae bacterium]|nr:hypothetical protein [Flavobacteriaceae bacterium]